MTHHRWRLPRRILTTATALLLVSLAAPAMAAPCRTCDDPPDNPIPQPPQKVTVTGTFHYQDRISLDGSVNVDVPIAQAKVEVWRLRARPPLNIVSWGKDAETTTDAAGRISLQLDFLTAGITYAVRVFATNRAAVVWPEQTVRFEPFWREPGQGEGGPIQRVAGAANVSMDFSHTFRDRWIAQHFNVAETLRIGRGYVDSRRADVDPLGPANVSISAINAPNDSFYNYLIDEVVIGIGGADLAAFRDGLILHEYGHHVLDQISATTLDAADHTGCPVSGDSPTTQQFAWQEGAATYLAAAVKRVNPQSWLAAATLPDGKPFCPGVPGELVEGKVAAALWDLVDTGTLESFDQLAEMDDAVMQVIDARMDDGQAGTIGRFRAGWSAAGHDLVKLDAILAANDIFNS